MRHLEKLGAGTGVFGTLLLLGCCLGPAWFSSLMTALGLGFLMTFTYSDPFLYAGLSLTLGGLAYKGWRHGSWWPLAVAVLGVSAIFLALTQPMEVPLFLLLMYGGAGVVLLAAFRGLVERGLRAARRHLQ